MKEDIWGFIKSKLPQQIAITIAVSIGIPMAFYNVLNLLTDNNVISIPANKKPFIVIIMVIFGILLLIGCVFFFLNKYAVNVYITERTDPKRNKKFDEVNNDVKNTYYTLGVDFSFLSSLMGRDKLKKFIESGVKVKMLMLNPSMVVEDLCEASYSSGACALHNIQAEKGDFNQAAKKFKSDGYVSEKDDLLKMFHVLLNENHIKEYYDDSARSYRSNISKAYSDLQDTATICQSSNGRDCFEVRMTDTFIPISLTIIDAKCKPPKGKLVFELQLPYSHKIMGFKLDEHYNKVLFEELVDFYNRMWERTKPQ